MPKPVAREKQETFWEAVLRLRKAGNDRIAKIIDSPYHPYSDVRFTVNEKGIDDIESEAPKKKLARQKDDD